MHACNHAHTNVHVCAGGRNIPYKAHCALMVSSSAVRPCRCLDSCHIYASVFVCVCVYIYIFPSPAGDSIYVIFISLNVCDVNRYN